ncbi:hypothetical protein GCM10028805_47350 [Spirosoma harenae]
MPIPPPPSPPKGRIVPPYQSFPKMDKNAWIGAIVLIIVALIVTDCSMGKTRQCQGVVRQHEYQPGYWSGSGKDHTYHQPEYHLLVYVPSPEHAVNLDVSALNYLRYRDGAAILVSERCGRWTSYPWVKWLSSKSRQVASSTY